MFGKSIILSVAVMATALSCIGQDTTLNEVQVIGIRSDRREPSTIVRIKTDSVSPFLTKQDDPFFQLEKTVPSIYSQSDNGQSNSYSYMRMRGLDQTRINFNLNGVPLNEMEDQGIYFSNMPGFWNYLGEVSVQKGVGTSKYGNSSIAGSVNMETRNQTEKTFEYNTFAVGTYRNSFSNFFYSNGINKSGVGIQVGGTYGSNTGFRDHSENRGGSAYYSIGHFSKDRIVKLYGFSGRSINQLSFYGVDIPTLNIDYRTNLNSPNDRDTFRQNFTCLNWVENTKRNVRFNTSTYFNNVDGTYNTGGILFGVSSLQFGAMSNMVYEKNRTRINIGTNINIYSRKHFGSDSSGFFTDQSGNPTSQISRYDNVGYKKDAVIYLKGIDINGNFNVFYDIQMRSVWFNMPNFSKNWIFLNPKFGLKKISKNADHYLNFGFTQREPTRTDIIQNQVQSSGLFGTNTDNTSNIRGNTSPNPEKLINVESGTNFHISGLEINPNVYFMNIQNEYVATGNLDFHSGLMEKKSVTSTVRAGLEVNSTLRLSRRFSMFTNMQYQHNSYTEGNIKGKIPFTPSYIGTFGSSYRFGMFTLGMSTLSVSSMFIDISNSHSSMSYAVLNGFAECRKDRFTISLKSNNILNNKYYIPAMMVGTTPTFYVGQTYNWSLFINYKI